VQITSAILHGVVQKSSGRGRPQQFCVEEVLDRAMGVFWRRGYEAASLAELEAGTGANRSTLYNSFGGKRGLFLDALAQYRRRLGEQMLVPLELGHEGLADLHAFLERFAIQLEGPAGPDGCLMVNTMTELAGTDDAVVAQVDAYLERARLALGAALERAAERGEIPHAGHQARADALLALVLGINATARSGVPRRQVRAMLDAAHAQLDDWRALARR